MMRWYDYVVIFVMADLIWGNIKIALFAPTITGNIIGCAALYAIWHLWNNSYIPWRLKKEDEQ